MKNYYTKDKRINDDEIVSIYFLKVYDHNNTIKLFRDGINIKINEKLIKETDVYIENMISNNCDDTCLQNTNILLIIYKQYIKNISKKEKWIKSQGEFYALISLILLFRRKPNINVSDIHNPQSNQKLEVDFYIDEYNLAIEIDGKQHNNEIQKYNDKIKDVVLENSNITLLRLDVNNDKIIKYFIDDNGFYDKIKNFTYIHDYNILDKQKYSDIIKLIANSVSFNNFNYNINYEGKLDTNKDKQNIKENSILKNVLQKVQLDDDII